MKTFADHDIQNCIPLLLPPRRLSPHVPQSYPSGNQTIESCALHKSILIPIGEYFQIQGDFLDFSGTPEQIGTDILVNKCSWSVNTVLAVCTPEQPRILDDNYGRKDSECERRAKVVFESPQVDLRKIWGEGVWGAYCDDSRG